MDKTGKVIDYQLILPDTRFLISRQDLDASNLNAFRASQCITTLNKCEAQAASQPLVNISAGSPFPAWPWLVSGGVILTVIGFVAGLLIGVHNPKSAK